METVLRCMEMLIEFMDTKLTIFDITFSYWGIFLLLFIGSVIGMIIKAVFD